MKKSKREILFTVAAAAMLANNMTVCAAPERMADGTIFDAAYYADTYPDVPAEVGTDPLARPTRQMQNRCPGCRRRSGSSRYPLPGTAHWAVSKDKAAEICGGITIIYMETITFSKMCGKSLIRMISLTSILKVL